MRTISAETKLVMAVVALSVGVGAIGAELVAAHFEEKVEEVGEHVLQGAAETFAMQQRTEVEKLVAALDVVMASSELRAAFLAGDRELLRRLAAPVLETLREHSRITHWYFHSAGPTPRVFLRVHRPDLFGDATERVTLRRAMDTGEVGAGLELGRTAFALRVVRPWVVGGQVLGYVELAEDIDHFLTAMKGRTGDEYGLLVRKKYLDEAAWTAAMGPRATSWDVSADALVVDATSTADGILDWRGDVEALPSSGLTLRETEHADRAFIRGVFPVTDAAGRRVGALFVVHDFTVHHLAAREGHGFALAVMVGSALAAAAGVALLAHLLVFRRLARLRARMERRAVGVTPAGRPGLMTSPDDLGRIETLFERAFHEHAEGDGGDRKAPGPPPG
jgi:histidine kinase family protein